MVIFDLRTSVLHSHSHPILSGSTIASCEASVRLPAYSMYSRSFQNGRRKRGETEENKEKVGRDQYMYPQSNVF